MFGEATLARHYGGGGSSRQKFIICDHGVREKSPVDESKNEDIYAQRLSD